MPPTHDATGRTKTRSGDIMAAPPKTTTPPYRRNKIAGQFAARLIEMLESAAYRVMSLSAHRLLDRLEIEHAHHGGRDNGKLPVTYGDFENYGIASLGEPQMQGTIDNAYLRPRRRGLARGFFFRRDFGAPGNFTTTSPDTGSVRPSPAPKSSRSSRNVSRIPIIFGRASTIL